MMLAGSCPQSGPCVLEASNLKPFAFNAYFYPCIYTVKYANISRYVLREDVLPPTRLLPFAGSSLINGVDYSLAGDLASMPGIDCSLSSTKQETKTVATGELNGQRFVREDVYPLPSNPGSELYIDERCTYNLNDVATSSLQKYIDALFAGEPGEGSISGLTSFSTMQPNGTDGPQWLEQLYNQGNVNITSAKRFVEGIATSLTVAIRAFGKQSSSEPALGSLASGDTCVFVQWEWIVLPAIVVLLTLVLLIGTIIAIKGSGRGRAPTADLLNPMRWRNRTKETHGEARLVDNGDTSNGANRSSSSPKKPQSNVVSEKQTDERGGG